MIQNDDILNMNFYKKEKFTGSYQGMRYLIQKDQEEDAEDENVKHDIFRVTIWPGPYNFASTADDLKSSAVFPFTLISELAAVLAVALNTTLSNVLGTTIVYSFFLALKTGSNVTFVPSAFVTFKPERVVSRII